MKTDTGEKILTYIQENGQVTVQDLLRYLGHSPQAVHRQLKKLVMVGKLEKVGTPPRVYYQVVETVVNSEKESRQVNIIHDNLVEENFIQILPNGQELSGTQAFNYWCQQRNFKPLEYLEKYKEIWQKYNSYKHLDKNMTGFIDATSKLKKTYKVQTYLQKLFYLEFSALEIFGKTKDYTYLLYSKLNEDRSLMYKIFTDLEVSKKLDFIINKFQIQAVGFIPPTVPRRVQIQKELEKFLDLDMPKIQIYKLQTPILVPQKTLSLPNERIVNSQTTFVIPKTTNAQRILLIDDFAGSGATLNFVAKKIIDKNPNLEIDIYGIALCGTPNGLVNNSQKFEVVKEI